jgi:L-amino acid N-acyltransferase YncA
MSLIYGPPSMLQGQEENVLCLRAWTESDLPEMLEIWNEVVTAGNAFPQEEMLTPETGRAFFAQQTYTGVAELNGHLQGLYILHPNNVGRCGHICNASYAVRSSARGQGIGEGLVRDCMIQGSAHGFRILQFNAVVEGNLAARNLYERLGFQQLGTIEGGFRMPDGTYVNICPYWIAL